MPAPYDYTLGQVPNPAQSFLQGIQTVDALRQREEQMAAAAQAKKQQEAFRTMQTEYWNTPNPTLQQTMRFASMLPKDQAEMLFKGVEAQDKAKTQANLALGGQVLSSLLANNKDTAVKLLRERETAAINSGDKAGSQQWGALAQQIEIAKPEESFKIFAPFMAAYGEEGRKMLESVYGAQKHPIELQKLSSEAAKEASLAEEARIKAAFAEDLQRAGLNEKNWNTKNLQSQIADRSARLKLSTQEVNATVAEKMASIGAKLHELPESAQKLVNESAATAAASKQDAARMNDLAKQLESLDGGWGTATSLQEWVKSQYGGQDLRSALLGEYTRLANSAGIKAYKASGATGGFSDTDLKTALAGIPPSNSSPQQLASFMRGMAKMQDMDAALNNAKTDWLTENKGQLGRARSGFIAGDYAVKPGETYADFSARVSADIAKRYGQKPSAVDLIPTGQTPISGAVPARPSARDYRSEADAILRGGK